MTETTKKSFCILAVDDEEIVQSLIRDALEDEGHRVLTAADGMEALEILQSHSVDLILTDIRMPRMSGTELVERARALNPALGIIFMTGYASLTSAKDAIKQGALDYIMKPFELPEIRQAVRNGLAKLDEAAAAASHRQLTSLSDLSTMLFAAGDRQSLVSSSLRFAMMHLHSDRGSILCWNHEASRYDLLTIHDDQISQKAIGVEPLHSMALDGRLHAFHEPELVSSLDDHPVYQDVSDAALRPFLIPDWMNDDLQMIVVPVMRAAAFHGLMMLAHQDDTVNVKKSDLTFLAITASQLAITLENLALLEESQQAYSRLKELQDETLELEKMATRGQMSAEIGHELNNFLGVVAGNVDLLQLHLERGNYEKLGKYLSTMSSTLDKIKTFTDNLMDLRTASSKKEVIRFDGMIHEVVEYLRPQRRFDGVEISLPEEIAPVEFEADSTQIQQLLYNLFHNAADAMIESECKQIEVEVKPHDDRFVFSIRDTGCGFDPELLTKAFQEKFTTKESGHGFGLVVCKRIIENHGGELDIESAPGEGTRISIDFPTAVRSGEPAPVA